MLTLGSWPLYYFKSTCTGQNQQIKMYEHQNCFKKTLIFLNSSFYQRWRIHSSRPSLWGGLRCWRSTGPAAHSPYSPLPPSSASRTLHLPHSHPPTTICVGSQSCRSERAVHQNTTAGGGRPAHTLRGHWGDREEDKLLYVGGVKNNIWNLNRGYYWCIQREIIANGCIVRNKTRNKIIYLHILLKGIQSLYQNQI